MKLRSIAIGFALLAVLIAGCANFSNQAFRLEQTAENLAYTAYVGYTNALLSGTLKISADESNAVKSARLKFAATLATAEALRRAYETNSATKPLLQGALATLNDQASNVVWTINYVSKSK